MANLYGINGAQNWDAVGSWSTTGSGGASSGTVPTAATDVIFDAGYTGTMTVNGTSTCFAKTIVCMAAANKITLTAGKLLTVSGSITWYSGMGTNLSGTGTIQINGNATLTSNGVAFPGTYIFGGFANLTVTLADALTIAGALKLWTVNGGIYTTTIAGAFNISCYDLLIVSLINNATISLKSGQHLAVSHSMMICGNLQNTLTIQSSAASDTYLDYAGTPDNAAVFSTYFTYINASGSAQVVTNWFGQTLSNTTNIVNATSGASSDIFGIL